MKFQNSLRAVVVCDLSIHTIVRVLIFCMKYVLAYLI